MKEPDKPAGSITLTLKFSLDEDMMKKYPGVAAEDIADSIDVFRPYLSDDYHISVRPSGFPDDIHFVSSIEVADICVEGNSKEEGK